MVEDLELRSARPEVLDELDGACGWDWAVRARDDLLVSDSPIARSPSGHLVGADRGSRTKEKSAGGLPWCRAEVAQRSKATAAGSGEGNWESGEAEGAARQRGERVGFLLRRWGRMTGTNKDLGRATTRNHDWQGNKKSDGAIGNKRPSAVRGRRSGSG